MSVQHEDDLVLRMVQRPWEWPDSAWLLCDVMPKSETRLIRREWVALMVRIRNGSVESRFDELGWYDSHEDAWDYAERLTVPNLH